MTSVELRRTADGKNLECDWGVIENSEVDPRHGLKHLMLIFGDSVTRMLVCGPEPAMRGDGTVSCGRDGDRLFMHLDLADGRTTWELFEAHWWDNGDPRDIYVGRWPD